MLATTERRRLGQESQQLRQLFGIQRHQCRRPRPVVQPHSSGDPTTDRKKGGDDINFAIDGMAVQAQLRLTDEWKNIKFGFLGESRGGTSAMIVLCALSSRPSCATTSAFRPEARSILTLR
jgi:hypothetical protein